MCFTIIFCFALRHIKSFAKGHTLTKWQNGIGKSLKTFDDGTVEAKGIHALVDVLITSFYLVAVVDDAVALGGEGGDEQGNTGADVG